MENRIDVINVYKKFYRNVNQEGFLGRLINFIRGGISGDEINVLENISFNLKHGEILGIIGKNGSGKSTLLKAISGIYSVDHGKISVRGILVYLTGFGYGLKGKLTMRENIFLSGAIMGLSQKEIAEVFDDIVRFSELEDYIDTKLFKFSNGMRVRLANSIGLHCVLHNNPDILLVDEVIGGGADINFREKSIKKMEGLIQSGASVILVSHDLGVISKLCDRVIWVDAGKIVMDDKPRLVVGKYKESKKKY